MDAEWQTAKKYRWMQSGRLPRNINGCRVANCQEILMVAEWQMPGNIYRFRVIDCQEILMDAEWQTARK